MKQLERRQELTNAIVRGTTLVDGKSVAVTNLYGVVCTPIDPIEPEMQTRVAINSSARILETFVFGDLPITIGQYLQVAGVDYPIKVVERYPAGRLHNAYIRLYLEDVAR